MPDVRNTVSPQTIGDDHPCPGTSIFQRTFSVVDHLSTMAVPGAMPLIAWPRKPGQVSSGFGFPLTSPADDARHASAARTAPALMRARLAHGQWLMVSTK